MKPRVSAPRLARLLAGWSTHTGPLHDQLTDALRGIVAEGELERGVALPSERELAATLTVSRTTVATSYDQLRGEGWLDSRHGSGTWVRRAGTLDGAGRTGERLSSYLSASAVDIIDLSSSALPGLPMVAEVAGTLLADRLPDLVAESGFEPYGLELLRDRVAHYYDALGMATRHEQILVTNGAQHALQLLATTVLEPGDTVLVEDTTYRGAIETFRTHGAQVVPVSTDDEGMNLDELERKARATHPRLVYLLPAAHNPTGRSWSPERRRTLGRIAGRHELSIVDDGSTMDLLLDEQDPRPLALDLPQDNVITLGSTTKLFWGGLRVGWVRAGQRTLTPLARARCTFDLGGSLPAQVIAAELLPRATRARAIRRTQLRAGYAYLTALIADRMPEWTWQRPSGGAALWVRTGQDAVALSERAQRFGLRLNPGPIYSPEDAARDWIRLPLLAEHDALAEGLDRIAAASSIRDGRSVG